MDAAGHPEVQTRPRPPVQLEPQVLAVASHRLHAAADEGPAKAGGRDAFEDDRIVGDVHVDDAASRRYAVGRAPRRLDLRELGHALISRRSAVAELGAGPPSTMMVSPVMKDEASEARKMHGYAISSTLPQRPMPMRLATVS